MKKYDAMYSIFQKENIFQRLNSLKRKLKAEELLEVISRVDYSFNRDLSVSEMTISRIIKLLWPEKSIVSPNTKLCSFLLQKHGLKFCNNCQLCRPIELFHANKARPDGLNNHCKECCLETRREYQREYQATRKANKQLRTPKWANLDKIKEIYKNCPDGMHVDHIVPINGTFVSGLHVENNLQYLTAEENIKKNNKFIVV